MNRFKNYGLWLSIFAFVPLLLESFGLKVLPKNYSEIVNSFLGILVIAGILNNPITQNKGYLDDEIDDNEEKKDDLNKE
ncbi:holin [Haloimpatiens lingqiaonensis]|uniref:holin n=1 Tax=Haloimpatiens lingqiaonensis TaxID=1380675 RepID=UPI0010FF1DB4|nr:holin [Haloimpatiens lingqiaonensis]